MFLAFDAAAPGALVIPGLAVVVAEGGDAQSSPSGGIGTSRRPLRACSSPSPPRTTRKTATKKHPIVSRSTRSFPTRTSSPGSGPHPSAIRAGELGEVVLAREVAIVATEAHQHDLLERIRALHPTCTAFALDGFVGASPELLVRRHGGVDRVAARSPGRGPAAATWTRTHASPGGSSPPRRTGSTPLRRRRDRRDLRPARRRHRRPPARGIPRASRRHPPRNPGVHNATRKPTRRPSAERARARRRTAPDTGGRRQPTHHHARVPEEKREARPGPPAPGPVGWFDARATASGGSASASTLSRRETGTSVRRGRHRRRLRPRPRARRNPAEVSGTARHVRPPLTDAVIIARCFAVPVTDRYVHGYHGRENDRLHDQAGTLVELLHHDTDYPPGSRCHRAAAGQTLPRA